MTDGEFAERPWGTYTVLSDDASDHKVKRIVVHPGKRLSYQRHAQRAEHWFFVSGLAQVTLDGTVRDPRPRARPSTSRPGRPTGWPTTVATDVVFIEVQHGTYFGEDDIVRLEDDFGRADAESPS